MARLIAAVDLFEWTDRRAFFLRQTAGLVEGHMLISDDITPLHQLAALVEADEALVQDLRDRLEDLGNNDFVAEIGFGTTYGVTVLYVRLESQEGWDDVMPLITAVLHRLVGVPSAGTTRYNHRVPQSFAEVPSRIPYLEHLSWLMTDD